MRGVARQMVGAAVHVYVCLAAVAAPVGSPILLNTINAAAVSAVLAGANALEKLRITAPGAT